MPRHFYILSAFIFLLSFQVFAQKDSISTLTKKQKRALKKMQRLTSPLSPSKAAFYSAIFPGGGQIYNRKYWKAPLALAAVGIPTYFYLDNNSEYKRYRRAFKLRRQGLPDEFTLEDGTELISEAGLVRAQRSLQNNRDLSLLFSVIGYVLQIVEASVNAHLLQFNTDENLSFKPVILNNQFLTEPPTVGLKLTYKIK